MSLSKFNKEVNNHQSLPDKPTLTADELKAIWDKAVADIKEYINDILTTEIDSALASKANTSQTDTKISTEFIYEDLEINISTDTSNPVATGDKTFTIPTGYDLFTANIIKTPPTLVGSIMLIQSNQIWVNTIGSSGGYFGKVTVRMVYKKSS